MAYGEDPITPTAIQIKTRSPRARLQTMGLDNQQVDDLYTLHDRARTDAAMAENDLRKARLSGDRNAVAVAQERARAAQRAFNTVSSQLNPQDSPETLQAKRDDLRRQFALNSGNLKAQATGEAIAAANTPPPSPADVARNFFRRPVASSMTPAEASARINSEVDAGRTRVALNSAIARSRADSYNPPADFLPPQVQGEMDTGIENRAAARDRALPALLGGVAGVAQDRAASRMDDDLRRQVALAAIKRRGAEAMAGSRVAGIQAGTEASSAIGRAAVEGNPQIAAAVKELGGGLLDVGSNTGLAQTGTDVLAKVQRAHDYIMSLPEDVRGPIAQQIVSQFDSAGVDLGRDPLVTNPVSSLASLAAGPSTGMAFRAMIASRRAAAAKLLDRLRSEAQRSATTNVR